MIQRKEGHDIITDEGPLSPTCMYSATRNFPFLSTSLLEKNAAASGFDGGGNHGNDIFMQGSR